MGKKTEQSRKTYNEKAQDYGSAAEGNYTKAHKAELVKKVVLREGDAILDVACGTGDLLGTLCKKADVKAFGVDISENMIAAARKGYPEHTFTVGPCAPLDFADESMDVITVSCAFHHFEAPQAFAKECMRVLKKGGSLFIAEPFYSPVVRWLANTVVFPFSRTGDVKVYSRKGLRCFFEAAGFTDIRTDGAGTVLFLSAKKPQERPQEVAGK